MFLLEPVNTEYYSKMGQDLYVGNRAKYAGFAINAQGQTLPNLQNKQVTYAEHAKEHKITAKQPNWYNVYTLGGLINKDIDKAFKKLVLNNKVVV